MIYFYYSVSFLLFVRLVLLTLIRLPTDTVRGDPQTWADLVLRLTEAEGLLRRWWHAGQGDHL